MLLNFHNLDDSFICSLRCSLDSNGKQLKMHFAFCIGYLLFSGGKAFIKRGNLIELQDDSLLSDYNLKRDDKVYMSLGNGLSLPKSLTPDESNEVALSIILHWSPRLSVVFYNKNKSDPKALIYQPTWIADIMYQNKETDGSNVQFIKTSKQYPNKQFVTLSESHDFILSLLDHCPHPLAELSKKRLQIYKHWPKMAFTLISDSEDGEYYYEHIDLQKTFAFFDRLLF